MDYKVLFTEQARQDLDDIFIYYSTEFSENIAKKVFTRLQQIINLLTFSPEGGINFDNKIVHSLYPGNTLRMIVSKQYLLFYLIREKEVHILRIINSRTDYLNQLDHLFRNRPITKYIEKSPD
ncbi:type II toxin-antitoxin system RelE/ParE family toxin [Streptococcus pneumoniae]|uniref:Plasmid stabilization system protein n=1 Tax=Streptococcus pneumoniae TaxID=1313 RepID=A0AA95D8Q5_STREE|nr:type II toxin-antitoxin system RelE/ParE family toxin [Streptococcus pseudopneumoniae]MDS2296217.1 type II toxin-antitoxin system RelE/ParE family toxin [Streptococcus pneumoniae]MBF9651703.1 type II toxin-antitoxin system RelE/ParE family toxin [Streptococcus pseudopneumoniae]MDS2574570.1 type II toxin-antitoxin system RelE/ParE family toxin [Streptococcus pneumoniae]MDS2653105.1 type II toxin-antitoxin system RelE/ParE family toxin [Streptococcus pneumoniae]MDS2764199.1 type II toxin-anti